MARDKTVKYPYVRNHETILSTERGGLFPAVSALYLMANLLSPVPLEIFGRLRRSMTSGSPRTGSLGSFNFSQLAFFIVDKVRKAGPRRNYRAVSRVPRPWMRLEKKQFS